MGKYFQNFYRGVRSQLWLSVLIVLTLTTGFVTAFFVYIYVGFEMSYDDQLDDNLYRVNVETVKEGEIISKTARTPPAVGTLLKEEVPEIRNFSRLVLMGEVILQNEPITIREKDVLLADLNYFDQFDYSWLHGNESDMDKPFYLAFSRSLAERLFGRTDISGEEVMINSPNFEGSFAFTISGVYEDILNNSHLRPNILLSYSTLYKFVGNDIDESWNWNNLYTYVIADGDREKLSENANHAFKLSREEYFREQGIESKLIFQHIQDIHTEKGYVGEFVTGIDRQQLVYIGLLAIFILLMTYTNFLNLFLVRTVGKRREMAVRSVMGSTNFGIVRLAMGDIIMLHLLAAVLTITIIQFINPYVLEEFNLTSIEVPGILSQGKIILGLCCIGVVLSSVLTSIRFGGVNWSRNLSGGRTTASRGDIRWYTYLLGTQLVIAIFFMAGSVVVYHQIRSISTYDPGLDLSDKIIVKAPLMGTYDANGAHKTLLWSEVSDIKGISSLVNMNEVPGSELYWRMDNVGRKPNEPVPVTFAWLAISEGYMDFFEVKLLAGRDFKRNEDTYNSSIILNETGMRLLGFENPDAAIDQTVYFGEHPIKIIGVVSDFVQENLRKGVEPQFFRFGAQGLNYFAIQAEDGGPDMELLKEAYSNVFPEAPFDYFDLQQHYDKQYASERLLGRVILAMAIVALFIAVSGIIGMSLQILERRSKELVIKKIHGASGLQLWRDVAITFYRISFIALFLGLPLAYYVFDLWLNQFVVSDFPVLIFMAIPVLVLSIVLFVSITFQILHTIRRNPREILVSD